MILSGIGKLKRYLSRRRSKTIEFRFALPAPNARTRLPEFYNGKLAGELASLAQAPLEQIGLVRKSVHDLNRCKIGPKGRLDVSRRALVLFMPLLRQAMGRFAKEGGVPDAPLRRDILDACGDVLHLLAQSFLSVFKSHYDKPDAQFAHEIETARLAACRALELIHLEQRVCGLRYKELPDHRWYAVDTLFHIMRAYDDVEASVPQLDTDVYENHAGRQTSLRDAFLALQMTRRLDLLQWPASLQGVLAGYLEAHLDQLAILDGRGEPVGPAQWACPCSSSAVTPSMSAGQKEALPSLVIDFGALGTRIRQDCTRIVQAQRSPGSVAVPKKMQQVSSLERLALAHHFVRSLEAGAARPGRELQEPVQGMHMYVSFRDVYLYIFHILSGKARAQGQRFVDLFAGRSAVIAEDHDADHHSLWFVLRHDNRIIRLKTQETDFTTPLEIGSLVAYELGERDRQRPRLAIVSRICRPDGKNFIVDMDRLAKYAEPVSVERADEGEAQPEQLAGLLVHDPDLGWNLLFSSKNTLAESCPVRVMFRGRPYVFNLGPLKQVTAGFYLYGVPLDSRQFDLDYDPVFPAPPARQETG